MLIGTHGQQLDKLEELDGRSILKRLDNLEATVIKYKSDNFYLLEKVVELSKQILEYEVSLKGFRGTGK
jgi:hypothetical protein